MIYRVAWGRSMEDLENMVHFLIREGYEPLGGVSLGDGQILKSLHVEEDIWVQAMVKEDLSEGSTGPG